MPIDRERQRAVREGVEQARRFLLDAPAHENTHGDDGVRCENLAEVIALLVAQARDAGSDETLLVEIVLRVTDCHSDTLLEARRTLDALGYTDVAALLKRLARIAPRRLTWREQMKVKAQQYAARRQAAGSQIH